MGLEYLLLGVRCYVFSFSWHLFLEATYVYFIFLNGRSQDDPNFVANHSQVTPGPVAFSSDDLSAILEAQKNSILAALYSQNKDIRTSHPVLPQKIHLRTRTLLCAPILLFYLGLRRFGYRVNFFKLNHQIRNQVVHSKTTSFRHLVKIICAIMNRVQC